MCHIPRASGHLGEVRMLDISDLKKDGNWLGVKVEGKPPNAVDGYACCVWEGKRAALFSGGRDDQGRAVSDIFLLHVRSGI